MGRRKACFVISCFVLGCLLSVASIQGNIGQKGMISNLNSSIVPMSTYVGLDSGNEFHYNITMLSSYLYLPKGEGWISIYPGLSNGTYNFTLTVDNATVNGQNMTIGYHGVLSNSTDASIITLHGIHCKVTINATDTAVTEFDYFINKNIASKNFTQSPGPMTFDYESAKWDNSGVMTSFSEWKSTWSINFTRIYPTQSTTPTPTPTPTPSSTPGFLVEFTVFGFVFGVLVIIAITSRKRQLCA
jgi:hypothetical protein